MIKGFRSLVSTMICAVQGREYRIFGYKSKQVRDNIHSYDLVNGFYHFFQNPRCGKVYNMGGSRFSHCSMMESIQLCGKISGCKMKTAYLEKNRIGDHIGWVSDVFKFSSHYPGWSLTKNTEDILGEIYEYNKTRWVATL